MLGSPLLYLKGMRAIMFQLSGFYYIVKGFWLLKFRLTGLKYRTSGMNAGGGSGCKSHR